MKCDDSGPPCKPCRDLGADCTYKKPSKRRGPPNKHAEGTKRIQLGPPDMQGHESSSPTHAAETLASISLQQGLSAEMICPAPVVMQLVDDYFTYIHPLIPIPHEKSFRNALDFGEATRNKTFLSLLASMVGCVAAVYPQKPMQHFQFLQIPTGAFSDSLRLVERCHDVIMESQGTGERILSIHDAQIEYLRGLIYAYSFSPQMSLHHFIRSRSILNQIGAHKASTYKYKGPAPGFPQARMTTNGETLQGPQPVQPDLVLEELTKRLFWTVYMTVRSLQQSGVSPDELDIPPPTKADPYPSLPLEVGDSFLTPDNAHQMPPGFIPSVVGFNTSVRIYLTYLELAGIEQSLRHLDYISVSDSERESLNLKAITCRETALNEITQIQQNLPPDMAVDLQGAIPQSFNQTFPTLLPQLGLDTGPFNYSNPSDERRRVQVEVQKVNINHGIISTRIFLEREGSISSR